MWSDGLFLSHGSRPYDVDDEVVSSASNRTLTHSKQNRPETESYINMTICFPEVDVYSTELSSVRSMLLKQKPTAGLSATPSLLESDGQNFLVSPFPRDYQGNAATEPKVKVCLTSDLMNSIKFRLHLPPHA